MHSSIETHFLRPRVPFEATYHLNVSDAVVPPVNNGMAFIYATADDGEKKETIVNHRKSLQSRLQSSLRSLLQEPHDGAHGYPELLGKIHEDKRTNLLSIQVKKSSAVRFFVAIRDDVHFNDLRPDLEFPSGSVSKEVFAPLFTGPAFPESDGTYEGFWAQLTFITGGFVLVTCRHHWLSDGNGLTAFLRLWFERARKGETEESTIISIDLAHQIHDRSLIQEDKEVEPLDHPDLIPTPGSGRTLLPGIPLLPRWAFNLIQFILAFMRLIPFLNVPHPASQIFRFKPEKLQSLRALDTKNANLSINSLVLALLWRCIVRARCDDPKKMAGISKMATMINMRSRLDPPLPWAWFGNALCFSVPTMSIKELTQDASLSEIAQCIKNDTAHRATDRCFRSILQLTKKQNSILDSQLDLHPMAGKDILGSNWTWFFPNIKDLDLGYGSFQRMRWPSSDIMDGMWFILPAYGLRDCTTDKAYPGGLEVRIELNKPAMARLKADDEFREYASWCE